jgi:DNA-directed RNA polymerase specialized sigma24 family protein
MGGDADLVARVRRGDRQAFDDLYDRYADDVFSMCLVVLGDPTVARAAAGTAFALVARTRMNPLSEPSRLRSWLLELARGSALAWSGSPQARSVPVPHGVSAEEMIEGAVVPAPASLHAGLARTFDRAATTAAHERAANEHLAARNVPRPRITGAAAALTGAAALAANGGDVPATGAGLADAVGALAASAPELGAAAGPVDAEDATVGAGSHEASAHSEHEASEAAEHAVRAVQADSAQGHALESLAEVTLDAAANVTRSAKTAGRFSRKSAGHGTKAARPAVGDLAAHATADHGTADHGTVTGGASLGGHAAGADQPVALVKPSLGVAAESADDLDVDPPTLDTELPANVLAFVPANPFNADDQFYADGQGAPLVPIDDLEIRHGRGLSSDWRTRPAIAIAASLVVAVAGITAALNWPTPSANLSADNFPDAAIVAPSLVVSAAATSGAPTTPPGFTPPAAPAAPVVIITHSQPRPVVDHRLIVATTPPPPSDAGAPTQPSVTPSPTATVVSPPTTTHGPTATTSPTATPTRPSHTPSPTGGAPTSPVPTQPTQTTPPPAGGTTQPVTTASPPLRLPHPPAVFGTIDSGSTANM